MRVLAFRKRLNRYRQRKEQKMELLIIRHGDPDYKIDSLTKKGWKEAEYLSENW